MDVTGKWLLLSSSFGLPIFCNSYKSINYFCDKKLKLGYKNIQLKKEKKVISAMFLEFILYNFTEINIYMV